MFENLCTLPLSGALLSQALHPTEPILTVGLYDGRVQSFRLPPALQPGVEDLAKGTECLVTDGKATIETLWDTRRHKRGCRGLAYTPDGNAMFSAGADGLVKHFDSRTGRVTSKVLIPQSGGSTDAPSTLLAIDPNHILLGCDSGALHVFDVRTRGGLSARPARTTNPHGDAVSAIVPVPGFEDEHFMQPATGFPRQFITTGGSTLVVSDLRSDKVVESEDQEDDLLCAAYVPGLGRRGAVRGALAVGCSTGVVTLWDRGAWDDQTGRVVVDKEESVDALVAVPSALGYGNRDSKAAFAATGDGRLTMIDAAKGGVVREGGVLRHDELEAAVAIGFDCYNRLVTGGGKIVKIWEDLKDLQVGSGGEEEEEEEEEADDDDDDDDDGEDEGEGAPSAGNQKRGREESSEDEDDSDSDSDSEDEREREKGERQRIRREAIAARLGPMGAHGVLKFDDLD